MIRACVDKRTNSDGALRSIWTVRDLAKATGLHRNTITNIEVGRYAGNRDSIGLIESCVPKSGRRVFATERRTLS